MKREEKQKERKRERKRVLKRREQKGRKGKGAEEKERVIVGERKNEMGDREKTNTEE